MTRDAAVRRAVSAALMVLAASAVVATSGPPRVVLLNTAIEVERPWPHSVAWLALALACVAVARLETGRVVRRLALAAALMASGIALDDALSRVRLDDAGMSARGLFGTASLAWPDVERVDSGSSAIVVSGAGERQVRLSVGSYRTAQRETLERSIARHVRDARRAPATPAPR